MMTPLPRHRDGILGLVCLVIAAATLALALTTRPGGTAAASALPTGGIDVPIVGAP